MSGPAIIAWLRRIHFALLAAALATISFSTELFNHSGLLVILLTANATLMWIGRRPAVSGEWKWVLLFTLLYLVCLTGIPGSSDVKAGVFVLEKKLSLLVFPFIMVAGGVLQERRFLTLLLCFVLGCVFSAIFCLATGLSHYVLWDDPSFFFYRLMSTTVGMHAIYLSMYYCLAVAFLLFFADKIKIYGLTRLFYWLAIFLLSVAVILLSGRIAMLLLVLMFMVFGFRQLRKRFSLYHSLAGGAVLAVGICLAALLPPKNRLRLMEAFSFNGNQAVNTTASGAAARPFIWSCAMEIIRREPLSGVGIGDSQNELTNCYIERRYAFLTDVYNMKFNAHNQFLEQAVGLGLPGLIVFIAGLLIPGAYAFRTRNWLYVIFLLIFCVCCLTESILERQSGVIFFAVFNSLLFFRMPEKPISEWNRAPL